MNTWQLQEAKNKFSEVVERALREGPQLITRHGKPVVVVQSIEQYEKSEYSESKGTTDLLLAIPKDGTDDDLFERVDSPMRDIDW